MIVQRLRALQNKYGYLPDAELEKLAREIDQPLYKIEEVASFFPAFRQQGRNEPEFLEIRVCQDMTCHHRGAETILTETLPALKTELEKTCNHRVNIEGVSCLGRCDRAPVMWVERHDHHANGHAANHEHGWVYTSDPQRLVQALRAIAAGNKPPAETDTAYQVLTNAPFKAPIGGDSLPAPQWEINVYDRLGEPRNYRAVRQFTDSLKAQRLLCIPPPQNLKDDALDRYIRERHPMLWELSDKDLDRRKLQEKLEQQKISPEEFRKEEEAYQRAKLLGMGGAGMAAFSKWFDLWRQPSNYDDATPDSKSTVFDPRTAKNDKYIVANGDESEPGTFKDRELMLRMPHLVVEGVILAGLMTGATKGFIYVRHEFHEQIAALRKEVERARDLGACGSNVFGCGRGFEVEVFESPGGYICGEQSALIEAMEDRRSQPRNRPPELTTNGYRDRPTVVNNVETLAWAPYIMLRGGKAYREQGVNGYFGRRLFSVSGDVNRPGVYEVPIGLTLGELIENKDLCGGILDGRRVGFIATSGPSGGIVPAIIPLDPRVNVLQNVERSREPEKMRAFLEKGLVNGGTHLNLLAAPLELNFFRNLQAVFRLPVEPMLGAGLAVYAEGTDPLSQAVNFTRFYRNESCGKCVPCRIGSHKLTNLGYDLIERRRAGSVSDADLKLLRDDVLAMTRTMQQTSICGLGYVAPIPLSTALTYFADAVQKQPG